MQETNEQLEEIEVTGVLEAAMADAGVIDEPCFDVTALLGDIQPPLDAAGQTNPNIQNESVNVLEAAMMGAGLVAEPVVLLADAGAAGLDAAAIYHELVVGFKLECMEEGEGSAGAESAGLLAAVQAAVQPSTAAKEFAAPEPGVAAKYPAAGPAPLPAPSKLKRRRATIAKNRPKKALGKLSVLKKEGTTTSCEI